MGRLTVGYMDFDTDKTQISVLTSDASAASYAAKLADADALSAAIDAVTLGTKFLSAYTADENRVANPAPPANGFAQSHTRWLVTYRDSINAHDETLSIPTADLGAAGLLLPNSDRADMTAAEWVAFVAAFEAFAVSQDGNPVTVIDIVIRE